MIRQIFLPTLLLLFVYIIGFYLHNAYLEGASINLPISLEKVYQFHFLFSTLLIIHFELLSKLERFRPQLGLIYLVSVVLKIVIFALVFKSVVIDQETIKLNTKFAMLFPALIFLIFEVVFIAKILLRKEGEY